jgi:preprotein translocase subunit YajC
LSIHLWQSVATPPGREAPNTPAAPPPTTTQQGAPPPADHGAQPQGGPGNSMLFYMLPLLVVMWVLMARSQSKKQKNVESSLKIGERVITQSGLIGKLIEVGETRVKIEIAPGVPVTVLKASVQGPDPGETKVEPKDKDKDKDKDAKDKDAKDDAKDKDAAKKDASKDKDKAQEKRA